MNTYEIKALMLDESIVVSLHEIKANMATMLEVFEEYNSDDVSRILYIRRV